MLKAASHSGGMRVSKQAVDPAQHCPLSQLRLCACVLGQEVIKRHQRPICDLVCWSDQRSCFHGGILESELLFLVLNKKESNENMFNICSVLAFPAFLQHLQAAKTWGEKEPRKMFYVWI